MFYINIQCFTCATSWIPWRMCWYHSKYGTYFCVKSQKLFGKIILLLRYGYRSMYMNIFRWRYCAHKTRIPPEEHISSWSLLLLSEVLSCKEDEDVFQFKEREKRMKYIVFALVTIGRYEKMICKSPAVGYFRTRQAWVQFSSSR